MTHTFFFYDLETSGLSARDDRIMQFAGQRTTMELEPIGEPVNIMVELSDDILPSPDAIAVTGITPQQTRTDGYKESQFCKMLVEEIFTPGTIAVGYNNVRFDDEFIRHTLWRNFYDPYEWAWSDGRSRWDMLDVVRMTRALRPEGISWPTDAEGKAVNKLELLAKENNLLHTKAHDALSDVEALIGLTKLLQTTQPKLFDYLLTMRDKRTAMGLVSLDDPKPFVYTSGRYDAAYEKTTIAVALAPAAKPGAVLVYDLRYDPTPFLQASPKQLSAIAFADRAMRADEDFQALPIKELSYNKCPAIAPVGVLDADSQQRLGIDMAIITQHYNMLVANKGFADAAREAYELREPYAPANDVEHMLYDNFLNDKDKPRMSAVRAATADELADFHPQFIDSRLDTLLLRYKARQFPTSLSADEMTQWEAYRSAKIQAALPTYLEAVERIARAGADEYIVSELRLWAESIIPLEN